MEVNFQGWAADVSTHQRETWACQEAPQSNENSDLDTVQAFPAFPQSLKAAERMTVTKHNSFLHTPLESLYHGS